MHPNVKDETGNRYGRLVVTERAKSNKGLHAAWLCLCDCGNQIPVRGTHLRSKRTQSCGCLQREAVAKAAATHGLCDLLEYNSWDSMIQRCTNPNNDHFADYGGRGIRICQAWHENFMVFYEDLGSRPGPEYSLERIDNDGNYEPGNCRWATQKQQCRNTRTNRNLTHNGKTLCVAAWAEQLGMSRFTLYNRLRSGWSVKKALTTPVEKRVEI